MQAATVESVRKSDRPQVDRPQKLAPQLIGALEGPGERLGHDPLVAPAIFAEQQAELLRLDDTRRWAASMQTQMSFR